jgi:nitroimidazol reductase NimA-like FMN-containing flavoprotein (pyridoxamine 5'-phosphate oxidase superfamily)
VKASSKRAKEIIKRIQYVTIASVTEDGMPWNSPVFAAYDENYNFYWGTHKDSQKAKNVRSTPNVFLVIYDSTIGAGMGEGVYIKAKAHEISDPEEVKNAFKLLKDRHEVTFWDFAAVENNGPIRLYKAIPQQVWMNDNGQKNGHYVDIRTEINL